MADELIDICDENNDLLGIQKMKSVAHEKGLWHRAAHIWIYNSKGDILIQLRSKDKPIYPGMWDISAAGHVSAGEEPIISGLREIKEEIGLDVKEEELEFYRIMKKRIAFRAMINNEFYYIYLLNYDGDIEDLILQDEEVEAIKFMPIKDLEEDLRANPGSYTPNKDYWFEMIDEIKKKSKKR